MTAVSTTTDIKMLLKLALPIGSRLVAGHPATPINWVYHVRHCPLSYQDLAGRELVLLSTSTLADDTDAPPLEAIIKALVGRRASALGVQGTITPRAQQVARTHDFPLISLPDRAVLPQVEQAVQRLLTDRDAQLSRRTAELQQTLRRHAAGYRGLTTMLNALARMMDRPVVVHDRRGRLLSRGLPASNGQEWDAHLALVGGAEFVRRFDLDDRAFFEDDWQVIESPVGLTAPLVHEGHLLGYISILSAGDAPDDFDLLALERSAPVLVRELARQQSAEIGAERPAPSRDWIADWLSSTASDDPLMSLRAEKDSYRAGVWYAAVLFHWVPASDRAGGVFSPERMVRLVRAEMRQRRIQAPVGQYADRVVLLFPLDEPQQTQRLKQMARHLHHLLTEAAPDGEITAGMGRPVQGLTALRESFQEAERALSLSEQLWDDESQVASFGDLSLYELLLHVRDRGMLRQFCNHWLAPLADYDRQHHTDLLPTLSAYFANNGNMARTAHLLSIHRNTLVYRLSRITGIMQLDMDDSNVRLNLHLALKIQRMLDGSGDQV